MINIFSSVPATIKQLSKFGDKSIWQITKIMFSAVALAYIGTKTYKEIKKINKQFNNKDKKSETPEQTCTGNTTSFDEDETSLVAVTADTLNSDENFQKSQSIDGDYMPRKSGYCILGAPQNEGKTTIALHLAMCRAAGIPTGLMGDTSMDNFHPKKVIMYCTEKDLNEMLVSGQTNYPDIPEEVKRRIQYVCYDRCRVTVKQALKHMREAISNSQDDIFAIYDCLGSEYLMAASEKLQADLRYECEGLVRMANEKRIIFQLVIVCHVLGGTYKIGSVIDSGSMRLSDTLIGGSRLILGIAPIGEECSQYKYLKVIRSKEYPEPKDVAVIKWQDGRQRFEHVTRMTEYDVLSKAKECK